MFRLSIILVFSIGLCALAQGSLDDTSVGPSLSDALTPESWNRVEQSIDRGLEWLAQNQDRDGSFHSPAMGQPGVTSLGVMAFLSRGHLPGEGPYGEMLDRAIEFVVRTQRSDGLFTFADPGRSHRSKHPSKAATYNHAIAGLMLTEVYGMTDSKRARAIRAVIVKGLNFTRQLQVRRKSHSQDLGGWRYLHDRGGSYADSDLSVTGWQLMFLRSAKNAGFDVPKEQIDEAMRYVYSCWDEQKRVFYYTKVSSERRWSRGMIGVGILSLSMAGHHQTEIARKAGESLLSNPFKKFGRQVGSGERYFYSMYYCSQAMAQLGGEYWNRYFPGLATMLLSTQRRGGDWPSEPLSGDSVFGNAYTTAIAVLTLTPPLQLLPVYQR